MNRILCNNNVVILKTDIISKNYVPLRSYLDHVNSVK